MSVTPRPIAAADAAPQDEVPHDEALCGVLGRIRDKWSVLVMRALWDGPLRFSALQRRLQGVSHRMLSLTLRGLERDGLVSRTVGFSIPPRVDYALTPLGRALQEQVAALGRWAQANEAAVRAAREAFDRRG